MTQKDRIIDILDQQGYVDNFYVIANRISIRLGAIIFVLKKEGWDFRVEMKDKNCHYFVTKKPEKHVPKESPIPIATPLFKFSSPSQEAKKWTQ